MAQRFFGFLNATRQYLKSLSAQAIGLPSYGTLIQWDSFIRALSPRPANQSMIQPRNLAAYYPNDPTAIYLDGSNNVILWEDWSGNSATNTLCLNGAAGNYASAPNSTPLTITGDIDIRAQIAPNAWSGTDMRIVTKYLPTGNQRGYAFTLLTTGVLRFEQSTAGTDVTTFVSTASLSSLPALSTKWVRATLDVDNGAAGRTVEFFTSDDGIVWTQLGVDVVAATAVNTFASTSPLEIGSITGGTAQPYNGRIYRAQIFNGINGTTAFDADFSKAAKLATSFTESSSNAATVTINSTGDTGARISGERDLYQGTSTKRPAYTQANGRQRLFLTFDGTDDYLKAPSFVLVQPETVYWVGRQLAWVLNGAFFDGNTANGMMLFQGTSSPNICPFAGGSDSGTNVSALGVGANGIVTTTFSSTVGSLRVNGGPVIPQTLSTNDANGFTLGARPTPDRFSNTQVNEVAIYSEASNTATANNIIGYFANKNSIGL